MFQYFLISLIQILVPYTCQQQEAHFLVYRYCLPVFLDIYYISSSIFGRERSERRDPPTEPPSHYRISSTLVSDDTWLVPLEKARGTNYMFIQPFSLKNQRNPLENHMRQPLFCLDLPTFMLNEGTSTPPLAPTSSGSLNQVKLELRLPPYEPNKLPKHCEAEPTHRLDLLPSPGRGSTPPPPLDYSPTSEANPGDRSSQLHH